MRIEHWPLSLTVSLRCFPLIFEKQDTSPRVEVLRIFARTVAVTGWP